MIISKYLKYINVTKYILYSVTPDYKTEIIVKW
jgi:hypothetical protein